MEMEMGMGMGKRASTTATHLEPAALPFLQARTLRPGWRPIHLDGDPMQRRRRYLSVMFFFVFVLFFVY